MMESQYGIGINNRYALFLDEEGDETSDEGRKLDPIPTRTSISTKNELDKKMSGVKGKPTTPKGLNNNNREDKENRGGERYQGKREARKSSEGHNNRKNVGTGDSTMETKGDRNENSRRGGRGARMDRGGGDRGKGPRAFGGRSRREFERKSGDDRTGIKPVDKRDGGGSHNWGTFEDDMKADEDKINTSNSDDLKDVDSKHDNADTEDLRDNGPVTMTLDEWKAQQAQKNTPKWNIRKAGEGSDIDPKWKKTYAYRKEKEVREEDEEEEAESHSQQRAYRQIPLDIEFNFVDGNSGRGGRDGGGRGRGGRGGRGGPGGDRRRNGDDRRRFPPRGDAGPRRGGRGGSFTAAPNVNDEASFPTLGIKK